MLKTGTALILRLFFGRMGIRQLLLGMETVAKRSGPYFYLTLDRR